MRLEKFFNRSFNYFIAAVIWVSGYAGKRVIYFVRIAIRECLLTGAPVVSLYVVHTYLRLAVPENMSKVALQMKPVLRHNYKSNSLMNV